MSWWNRFRREGCEMHIDCNELYEKNEQFKGYVDRYKNLHEISTEEALSHAMVRSYAGYLTERELKS